MGKPDYKAMDAAVQAFMAAYRDLDHAADDLDRLACEAYAALGGAEKDALRQLLFKGPVWDGDICSKSGRDALIMWGLAVRVCFKGEQGHTAATYPASTLYKTASEKDAEKLTNDVLSRRTPL